MNIGLFEFKSRTEEFSPLALAVSSGACDAHLLHHLLHLLKLLQQSVDVLDPRAASRRDTPFS